MSYPLRAVLYENMSKDRIGRFMGQTRVVITCNRIAEEAADMRLNKEQAEILLEQQSVQISNGLAETSADGGALCFDKRYGIMFCAYMPGPRGGYGESRGRISMSYFPASQPTNIRFIEIAVGDNVYCHNILGLGEGKVRVFYEKNSRADYDHDICFKDFDALTGELGAEKLVYVRRSDGSRVPLHYSFLMAYLHEHGYSGQVYRDREQILVGGCTYFRGEDGFAYGAAISYVSQVVLFRSRDDMETVEFFAVCPYMAQYEFDYKILGEKIYALYRTDHDTDSIFYTISADMGKTWIEPCALKGSIQCRPKLIRLSDDRLLMSYNVLNNNTEYRPPIQQGRTAVHIRIGQDDDPYKNPLVADLYSKYGIVNVSFEEILGDIYFAFSTSQLALEYQNGNPMVRGKDAVRYVKLGYLA